MEKYREDQAKYLMEEIGRWTEPYSHGTLIEFDFVKHLKLREQVQQICTERGWELPKPRATWDYSRSCSKAIGRNRTS